MAIEHWALSVAKAGHDPQENEDAWALRHHPSGTYAAIADGATETAFARTWAAALVEAFVEQGPTVELAAVLDSARQHFQEVVGLQLHDLPWYAAEKAEAGAAAAWLGLVVAFDGTWTAYAVGDCCLLHLPASTPAAPWWPLQKPEAFHHRPALTLSRPLAEETTPASHSGTWQPGDRFLLATDALAAHLMAVGEIPDFRCTPSAFASWVATARKAETLRNDDTTALLLTCAA